MIFKREPARILALVSAVVALAVGFGLPVTNEQVGLIMAVVAVVVGEGTRSQVYSPASVAEMRAEGTRGSGGRVTER